MGGYKMAVLKMTNDKLIRTVKFVRVFTVAAMVVGGLMELWSSDLFTTPVEQIGYATIAGIIAATFAKAVHFV